MNEELKKSEEQLYLLLEKKSLTIDELKTILDNSAFPYILKMVCFTFQIFVNKSIENGEIINLKYVENLKETISNLLKISTNNQIYHALKYIKKSLNKINNASPVLNESLHEFYDEITTLLLYKVDVPNNNQYDFIKMIIKDIKNISYLKQVLNTYPHYVNSKNKNGKCIVLELIDELIILLEKGVNDDTLYLDHVINLMMNKSSFHLKNEEIREYCNILRNKICSLKDDDNRIIYYQSLINNLLNTEVTMENIDALNKKYLITTTPSILVKNEMKLFFTKDYIVTIDSADTLDMDDALSITKDGDCYHAKVYITDVTSCVKPGSYIDKEAFLQSETLYLSDDTNHMLPSELSTQILSLNTFSSKLVYVFSYDIYENGDIGNFKVYKDYIVIDKKLDYKSVNKILKKGNSDQLGKTLQWLNEAALILKKHSPDKTFYRTLDDYKMQGLYTDKNKYPNRTNSEIIIEEFMVTTNYLISDLFLRLGYPFMFRNHLAPENKRDLDKLLQMKQIIETDFIDKRKHMKLVDSLLSMYPNAFYSLNNEGHFGLGLLSYCHATAPLRRYPDIIVYRLIEDYILKNPNASLDKKWIPIIQEVSQYCNERMKQNVLYQSEYERIKAFIKMK